MSIRLCLRRGLPLLLAIIAACHPRPADGPGAGPSTGDDAVLRALAALAALPVVDEPPRRGYDRQAWRHWTDADGDCQNTRHEVLIMESLEPVSLRADGCAVVAGVWRDPFTGTVFTRPGDLDIDHLVPLAEAHDSGGALWDADRRQAFANDLGFADALIAVDDATNQRKSDRDPAEWLPPDPAFHCAYAVAWVGVKARWGLAVDAAEASALEALLTACRAAPGTVRSSGSNAAG